MSYFLTLSLTGNVKNIGEIYSRMISDVCFAVFVYNSQDKIITYPIILAEACQVEVRPYINSKGLNCHRSFRYIDFLMNQDS